MKFAFVSTMSGSPWGGSEELWAQAAARLYDSGHQVSASVLSWPKLSSKITSLADKGVQLHLRKNSVPHRVWRKVQESTGRTVNELARLQRQKPDLVVISQGGNSDGLEWMKYCRQKSFPFIAISQCNHEALWPRDVIIDELAKAYKAARKVFCVSRHNLALLERQLGEPLPNASVVWNPYNVSPGKAPPWPEPAGGLMKLACVARLDPASKGQDLLFQILAREKWRQRPLELNLYGTGLWEKGLQRLANQLRLFNVHFRGHQEDVAGIWQDNHMLVLPSRYEGLPLALVEAMWCARPAVVTDIGGNAELCLDEQTGFVAAAPEVTLLEQTLERAWTRRHEWEALGKSSRRRVEQLVPTDPIQEFCSHLTANPQ